MGYGRALGVKSSGRSRFVSGQNDTIWIPPQITHKRPIIYSPPGVETAYAGVDPITLPGENLLLQTLSSNGALVVVLDWLGASWGSDVGAHDVRGAFETVRQAIPAVATALGVPGADRLNVNRAVLSGGSQGAVDCYGYALAQPSHVKAIGTWAGVTDLTGFYSGTYRWGGDSGTALRSAIGTAWNVTYPAALPARADPYDNAASITCPVLMTYSDGDATVTGLSQRAMAQVLPDGQAVRISTSVAHADAEAGEAAPVLAAWLLDQAA